MFIFLKESSILPTFPLFTISPFLLIYHNYFANICANVRPKLVSCNSYAKEDFSLPLCVHGWFVYGSIFPVLLLNHRSCLAISKVGMLCMHVCGFLWDLSNFPTLSGNKKMWPICSLRWLCEFHQFFCCMWVWYGVYDCPHDQMESLFILAYKDVLFDHWVVWLFLSVHLF